MRFYTVLYCFILFLYCFYTVFILFYTVFILFLYCFILFYTVLYCFYIVFILFYTVLILFYTVLYCFYTVFILFNAVLKMMNLTEKKDVYKRELKDMRALGACLPTVLYGVCSGFLHRFLDLHCSLWESHCDGERLWRLHLSFMHRDF